MTDGGYDIGYSQCPCFWGRSPGSLILRLDELIPSYKGLSILDAGCGEGKNAIYMAELGADVRAIDVSDTAISNAKEAWDPSAEVSWEVGDIRRLEFPASGFDIVIAYGLTHCFDDPDDIRQTIRKFQNATKDGGYHVLCAFNKRCQDLSAHPGFNPCLISHDAYLGMYRGWRILEASDKDLTETHPHNNIEHTHSMTRLIAQKRP